MAVNSLSNFGVPGMSGDRSAALQPIYTTHFRVTVFNFGEGGRAPYDITRQVETVSLPTVSFEVIPIPSYVSIAYVASRGQWEEGTLNFRDDIASTVKRRIEYQVAKQKDFYDQTMAVAASDYKFEMDVDILAGGATARTRGDVSGNVLRKYSYAGCFFTNVEDGEMQYESSNMKKINTRFRFDNVVTHNYNGERFGILGSEFSFEAGSIENFLSAGGLSFGISSSIGGATLGATLSF